MDPLLDTPAARVMRLIHREGPVNMRRFTEASKHSPPHAKNLRDKMETHGWIVVREATVRKITTDLEIDLTPKGRKIAAYLVAAEAEVDK